MKKYWEYAFLGWLALVPWGTVLIWREAVIEYNKGLLFGTEILFWVLFAWGLAGQYITRPRLNWYAYAALFFLVINSYVAHDRWLGLQSARYLLLAVAVVWMLSKSTTSIQAVVRSFALGLVPAIGLGLVQFFAQTTWSSQWFGLAQHLAWQPGTSVVVGDFGRWLRAYGPFPHPNIFGGYMVLGLLMSALGVKNGRAEKYWLAMAGLTSAGLVFSFSRSAWLGFVVAVVVGWQWFKDESLRLWWAVVSLTLVIGVGSVWPLVVGRTQVVGAYEQRSVSERVSGWHEAVAVWRSQPLVGVGLGNYTVALSAQFPGLAPWAYQPVHNIGLLALAELGVVGILLLAGVIWGVRRHLRGLWWVAPILIIGLFDHYFLTLYPGWVLLGVWVGIWTKFVHR